MDKKREDNTFIFKGGFVKDEKGLLQIVPMTLPDCIMQAWNAEKSAGDRKTFPKKRPIIHLSPLKMDISMLQEQKPVPQQSKEEKQIPKILFPKTSAKKVQRTSTYLKKSTVASRPTLLYSRKSIIPSKTKVNKIPARTNRSPALLDVDEAEMYLSNNNIPSSSIQNLLNPFKEEKPVTVRKQRDKGLSNMPRKKSSSMESISEFLELEQTCTSVKKLTKKSSLTSVCNVLKETTVTARLESGQDALTMIRDILKEDDEDFEEYTKNRQRRLAKVLELAEGIFIAPRRIASPKFRGVKSVTSTEVDLRKSTLNKALKKTLENESPRTRSAVNLYNSMRSVSNLLTTPKITRALIEGTGTPHGLSQKLQKQCLLLQDSPGAH